MKKYSWHKVAGSLSEIVFNSNNIATIEVDNKLMCLAKHGDSLFSFAHKCPHAGGLLSEGWIDTKGNVVCPVHGYKFNIENGRNVSGEGYKLKNWPVESKDDGIYVGIEDGLFSWL